MKHQYGQATTTIEVPTISIPEPMWEELAEAAPKPWPPELCRRDYAYKGGALSFRAAGKRWGMSHSKAAQIIKGMR